MPIVLNTPWNPGQFDPGQTYPRAKIANFWIGIDKPVLKVTVDFGDVVDGKWKSGNAERKEKTITVKGDAFIALIGSAANKDETAYDCIKRLLYNYLVSNVPELAGTIE